MPVDLEELLLAEGALRRSIPAEPVVPWLVIVAAAVDSAGLETGPDEGVLRD